MSGLVGTKLPRPDGRNATMTYSDSEKPARPSLPGIEGKVVEVAGRLRRRRPAKGGLGASDDRWQRDVVGVRPSC